MSGLLQRRIELYDDLLKAARGEIQVDTVIQGGTILNVHTGDLLKGNIGIYKGFIVSLFNNDIKGSNTIIATGKTLIPAFIDPHIHIESSMILPQAYAQITSINGTGTIFADPHEIVNVMGVRGFSLMVENSQNLPTRLYFDIPTCVPSKRGVETSGADIRVNQVKEMIQIGGKKLGELMSVEEIVSGDSIMADIIKAGWEMNIPRDSHFHLLLPKLGEAFGTLSLPQKIGVAMGIIGGKFLRLNHLKTLPVRIFVDKLRSLDNRALDTYLVALGFTADHENYGPELQLKLDRGMQLMISSHVFAIPQMLPLLITSIKNLRYTDSIGLCTDDLWPDELVKKGGMLGLVKDLVKQGLDPIEVVRFATLNNAQRLAQAGIQEANLIGAIAPGLVADIVILEGPLKKFEISSVMHEGKIIAKNGELVSPIPQPNIFPEALRTIEVNEISEMTFQIPFTQSVSQKTVLTRVLSLPKPPALPLPILIEEEIPIINEVLDTTGYTIITVMNRYKNGKKSPSKGLIRNYPINNGALASTVAHDSHNLIVLGSNIEDMIIAAKKVVAMNGGMAASQNKEIIASIELPIGGLMSNNPLKQIAASAKSFRDALSKLNLDPKNPIYPFALFSLPAAPGGKVTDLGLWDDSQKKMLSLFV